MEDLCNEDMDDFVVPKKTVKMSNVKDRQVRAKLVNGGLEVDGDISKEVASSSSNLNLTEMESLSACHVVRCAHCSPDTSAHPDIDSVKDVLPECFKHLVFSYEKTEDSWQATLRVNISTKVDVNKWLEKYQLLSKTFRIARTKPVSGHRVIYKADYRCHHNTLPRTESARKMSPTKKNTGCLASISLRLQQSTFHREGCTTTLKRKSQKQEELEDCATPDNETYYIDGKLPDITFSLQNWTGNLSIKLYVYNLYEGLYERIDYIITTQNISSNPQTIDLTGERAILPTSVSLTVSYQCDDNYYGPSCDVYCESSELVTGHYTCDDVTGKQTCSTGWTGPTCSYPVTQCPGDAPIVPVIPAGSCQAIDMLFVLDSSKSVNDIDSDNWDYLKAFLKAIVDRVTLGPSAFQMGVIVVSTTAQYRISLSSTYDPVVLKSKIDALAYVGEKTNLKAGLTLARTKGFAQINGGRPGAYQKVVIVYDGGPLSPEFGTWANEAPRLKDMGMDVSVVSLDYYFKQGMAQRTLVEAMASKPWITHLWTDLSDWSTLPSTVAPTILASAQDACFRKAAQNKPTEGTTVSMASTSPGTTSTTKTTTVVSTSKASVTSGAAGSATTATSGQATPTPLCSYRGYCSATAVSQRCYCMPGYNGLNCQYVADPCAQNPCNGGMCTSKPDGSYNCTCLPGFSGDDCEVVGGPVTCDAAPCSGGACVTPSPSPQCAAIPKAPCAEFYYGDKCDQLCVPKDSCRRGHYTCDKTGAKVCRAGWKNPENNCTESDGSLTCSASSCANGGTCFSGGCCCRTGFIGPNCTSTTSQNITTLVTSFETGSTLSGVSGSVTSGGSSVTSSPGVTGSVTSHSGSVTSYTGSVTSGGSTATPVSGGTTASQEACLKKILQQIQQNFADLKPAQKQQLINFLLDFCSSGGNSQFADFVLNAPPIFVSDPYPGTGQLSGSMIQLEVFKVSITKSDGDYQLSMTYDYIVTNSQGAVSRISKEDYDILKQDGGNIDTSLLNPANSREIKLYGNYLDQSQKIQIAEALKQTLGPLNQDWKAEPTSRVAIGQVSECLGQNGEAMTVVQFWLISGATSPYTEYNPTLIPADTTDMENILKLRLGSQDGTLFSHLTYYKMADCFRFSINGVVFRRDLTLLSMAVEKYWQQKYSTNSRVRILALEPQINQNGERVTSLIYILQNGTTLVTPGSVAPGLIPGGTELKSFINFQAADGSQYTLNTENQSNLLSIKTLFSVVTRERPDPSIYNVVQEKLQQGIRSVSGYESAVISVKFSEEFFSVKKRITYSKTRFSVTLNGQTLDSRSNGTNIRSMWLLAAFLANTTQANGQALTFVVEDLSASTELPRDSCFHVDLKGFLPAWSDFQVDLQATLKQQEVGWTENRISPAVAYLEQYIDSTGSSVTRVFYTIQEQTSDNYIFYDDSRQYPTDLISASMISDRLQLSRGSGFQVLVTPDATLQRYVDTFGTFYSTRQVTTLTSSGILGLDGVSRCVAAVTKAKGIQATTGAAIVEEYIKNDGSSIWRVGILIYVNGVLVRPESVYVEEPKQPSAGSSGLQSMLGVKVNELSRMSDLFVLPLSQILSSYQISSVQGIMASSFKTSFDEYEVAMMATKIVARKEFLVLSLERSSVYNYYYKVQADSWPVSALYESPPPNDVISQQLSPLTSWDGEAYEILSSTQQTFQADLTYQLYAYDNIAVSVANSMVSAVKTCWLQYQNAAKVEVALRGLKPAFGVHGHPVTIIYYNVSLNSKPVYPDSVLEPGQQCIQGSLGSLLAYVSGNVINRDTLHRLTVKSKLNKAQIKQIEKDLQTAWNNQIGSSVSVLIIGAQNRVTYVPSVDLATTLYYAVELTSNSTQIFPYDQTLQNLLLSDKTLSVLPDLNIQIPRSLTIYGSQLSGQDVISLQDILNNAVAKSSGSNGVTLNVLGSTQTRYSSDSANNWQSASRMDYVSNIGLSFGNSNPGLYDISGDISQQLSNIGLNTVSGLVYKTYQTFTINSTRLSPALYETLTNAITNVWLQQNSDVKSAEISVSILRDVARRKRDNRMKSSPTYQNLNGDFVTPIYYHVKIQGYDASPYLVSQPTDESISKALTSVHVNLVPACQTSCTSSLRQCSIITVTGAVQQSDYAKFQKAIAIAFAASNAPALNASDVTVIIKDNTLMKDGNGQDISRLSYCIQLREGSNVNIYDVIVPSYDVMGTQMQNIGRTAVIETDSTTTDANVPNYKKGLETSSIIIICVVCGVVALLIALAAVWMLIRYCNKNDSSDQDKKKLSIYDSDSFIGRGTYTSSTVSSGKRYSPGSINP